jgi:hypothetical protein
LWSGLFLQGQIYGTAKLTAHLTTHLTLPPMFRKHETIQLFVIRLQGMSLY